MFIKPKKEALHYAHTDLCILSKVYCCCYWISKSCHCYFVKAWTVAESPGSSTILDFSARIQEWGCHFILRSSQSWSQPCLLYWRGSSSLSHKFWKAYSVWRKSGYWKYDYSHLYLTFYELFISVFLSQLQAVKSWRRIFKLLLVYSLGKKKVEMSSVLNITSLYENILKFYSCVTFM